MEIRHLKLVKAVAEEGSLTSAGKRLFLSQSALSHQLKEVEERFGTALFQRLNKKMVLTQAGERILQTAEVVLCELEKTETDVRKFVNGDDGLIRISTECYTCYHWLPNLLKSYSKHFPNVEVRIVADGTRQPLKFLQEGKLDVAIISCLHKCDDMGPIKCTELFTDEMIVVSSNQHRFASQTVVSADQFADEHLICYTAPMEHLDIFQRVLIPAGVAPARLTKIQLTEAIVEMVKANLGVTVIAKWAIKPYLRSQKLIAVPVANHALRRTWYAATVNGQNQPGYMRCFIKHLEKHPIA